MNEINLWKFVEESNRIEGIGRPPTDKEVEATEVFVCGARPTVESLTSLVAVYTRGKGLLRVRDDMNVRVGQHTAPRGGPHIQARLNALLQTIEDADPFTLHVEFETLHPFIDGNGRGGRALWAWQMRRLQPAWLLDLGFLHSWYYQTLAASRWGLDEDGLSHAERCCGSIKAALADEIEDLKAQLAKRQRSKSKKQRIEEELRRSDLTAQTSGRDDIKYGHHETLPRGEHIANRRG